jgi:hypothetical protein
MSSQPQRSSDNQERAHHRKQKLATAEMTAIGEAEVSLRHHCHRGTWLIIGGLLAASLMTLASLDAFKSLGAILAIGLFANFWERRRIKSEIAAQSATWRFY